ncbi:unnamed protein product, partial [Choristocarpus tenellus]
HRAHCAPPVEGAIIPPSRGSYCVEGGLNCGGSSPNPNIQDEEGGRPQLGADNHLRCCQDMILLAHNDGTMFTCNKRVAVDDIFG